MGSSLGSTSQLSVSLSPVIVIPWRDGCSESGKGRDFWSGDATLKGKGGGGGFVKWKRAASSEVEKGGIF